MFVISLFPPSQHLQTMRHLYFWVLVLSIIRSPYSPFTSIPRASHLLSFSLGSLFSHTLHLFNTSRRLSLSFSSMRLSDSTPLSLYSLIPLHLLPRMFSCSAFNLFLIFHLFLHRIIAFSKVVLPLLHQKTKSLKHTC